MGKKKYVRCASPGAPISIDAATPNLAVRLRKYEEMSKGRSFDAAAFHRPGSPKK